MQDQPRAFHDHDHADCSADLLARAEALVARDKLRLTPVRRRVLEILAEAHRAIGAYEVLDRLKADGFPSQPPVAYRALDFLVGHGLAHRVRRLNAFAACSAPGRDHAPAFLICEECGAVAELAGAEAAEGLRAEAARLGFAVNRMSIEAAGTCPTCQEAGNDID